MRSAFVSLLASAALAAAMVAGCAATGSTTSATGSEASPGAAGPVDPSNGDAGQTNGDGGVDYFFGPLSTSLTPDSLQGRWAGWSGASEEPGVVITPDAHLQISSGALLFARTCDCCTNISAAQVAATVTASSIKTLESKTAVAGFPGYSSCTATVDLVEIPRCAASSPAAARDEGAQTAAGCFSLSGISLEFHGGFTSGFLAGITWKKLSD